MSIHSSILKNTVIGALSFCTIAMTTIGIGQAAPPEKAPSPVKKAQPVKEANHCKTTESMFFSMETKTYHINICGSDKPYDMVLFKKSDRMMERMSLEKADRNIFEANMKDNHYVLAKTPKESVFTITKVTYTEILREPVTKGWELIK